MKIVNPFFSETENIEAFEIMCPAVFVNSTDRNLEPSLKLATPSLPLCLTLNARSLFNKLENLQELLMQLCPDICFVSETWEGSKRQIN